METVGRSAGRDEAGPATDHPHHHANMVNESSRRPLRRPLTFHQAPMIDVSDRHFRMLIRCISPRA
ncbi:MAG: hypothetical protein ACPIOQ_85000, partial [Promethearchaeia archaeon]